MGMDEQSKLALQSTPADAANITIPDIVPGQSPEEMALKVEQARAMEDLVSRQEAEKERLAERLRKEAADEEEKAFASLEKERDRVLREARNKHAAELTARSDLSGEATQKLLDSHQMEMEQLMERQEGERSKQNELLRE